MTRWIAENPEQSLNAALIVVLFAGALYKSATSNRSHQ